jgi:hypothetical protein
MLLLDGILLILLSVLAVPSLLLSKKPEMKPQLDKLVPYQGWFGLISCVWGIWGIIFAIVNLSWIANGNLISWITLLAFAVVQTCLGFMLGYSLIVEYALKKPEAKAKGDAVLAKIQPFQGTLGIIGVVLGLW